MNGVWHELLGFPLPLLLASALALVLASVCARLGTAPERRKYLDAAEMWGSVALVAGGIGLVWMVTAVHATPLDVPAPAVRIESGELAACAASGGIQMVLLDGKWSCVPKEQAG